MSKTTNSFSKAKPKTAVPKKTRGLNAYSDDPNMKAKTPEKTLEGHSKAIREIAYSVNYKILVSVGFDFQVFVWNPYWEKEIISLQGHESPLIGVNCPAGLECFISCDNKGMIKVWDIKDYSCMQTLNVSSVK